jgi:hypothetical protein
MKNLKLLSKSLLIFFLLTATLYFSQTGIRITYYNGTTQDYSIENSGKLYFSTTDLLVKTSSSATNVSIPMTIIRKITFTSSVLATQEIGQNKYKTQLYPNPTSDFIKITSDRNDRMKVKIYSSAGQIVHIGTYLPNESIDISNLTAGFYLVQVDQTILKLIKK